MRIAYTNGIAVFMLALRGPAVRKCPSPRDLDPYFLAGMLRVGGEQLRMAGDRNAAAASRPVAVWHEHCQPEPASYAPEVQLLSAVINAVERQALKTLP
jgi:hypothetical protein